MNYTNTHKILMRRSSERGVALVLVLGMLVLLSGLLVAFLTTATTERTSTQSASDGATARQIADTTVNLMIGQIRDATTSFKADGSVNEKSTWASQPGAIRTFSGTQSSTSQAYPAGGGSFLNYTDGPEDYVFKLYSSDRLKVKSSDYMSRDLSDEVEVIQKWDRSNPDPEHVDLNEPILSPRRDIDPSGETVEPRYPIIDPRARYDLNDTLKTDPKTAVVEGFDAKISQDDTLKIPNKASTGVGDKLPYIPMPVKWLYVLRDGTVGPASEATDKNPIVGRTAFWTDDESCKLNINTSSEGTFWDSTSISSLQEAGGVQGSGAVDIPTGFTLSLAASQPMKGEYQRYPGHPATTSLSPVLGWLWGLTPMNPTNPLNPASGSIYPSSAPYRLFKEAIYQISPFLPYGKPTTQGASQNSDPEGAGNISWYLKAVPGQDVMTWDTGKPDPDIKTKHLYATVDELLFASQRNSGGNNPTGTLNGKLTPQALEKTRFFLTATSRAPEINLFGRPRVTIWPISKNPGNLRTVNDDLFAFASTIHKDPNADPSRDNRFHLEREDAKDDRKDAKLAQNEKMYGYLQGLMGKGGLTIPSFGGSFLGKYSADSDQILTEIFDYMRTVNMVDTGTASRAGNIFSPYTPRFFPLGIDPKSDQYQRYKRSVEWSGQATPLKVGNGVKRPEDLPYYDPPETMGLGRFPVISEAALVFHKNTATTPAPGSGPGLQCTLVLEMATAMPGNPGLRETYWTRVRTVRTDPQGFESRNGTVKREMKIRFGEAGEFVPVDFCTDPVLDVPGSDWPGYLNIVNVSNFDVAQGRPYLPILGYVNMMFKWPDHKAPTNQAQHMATIGTNPGRDPNRVETGSTHPTAKDFTHPSMRTPINNFSVTYKRGSTVNYYPYVSKPLKHPNPVPTHFWLQPPVLKVEIWSGEAPRPDDPAGGDDDRSRLVQVVTLDFNSDRTNPAPPPIKLPMPTSNGYYSTRLGDASPDGGSRDPIDGGDVVRSLEYTGFNPVTNAPLPLAQQGDLRLLAATFRVDKYAYQPRGRMSGSTADLQKYYESTSATLVHGLARGHGDPEPQVFAGVHAGTAPDRSALAKGAKNYNRNDKPPILPIGIDGVEWGSGANTGQGDFDRGISKHMDGSNGNKVDEGNLRFLYSDPDAHHRIPYFLGRSNEETGQSFFSPNRQLPSAVMFGSLPTGVKAGKPWQTLLFRPDRETGSKKHPGAASGTNPADHLLLDLFHMPVIEPFAISEPFSTMGKVNMNYVIAPFGYASGAGGNNPNSVLPKSYLRRETALRGVLKSTFVTAVPTTQADGGHTENPLGVSTQFRFPINLDKTIEEMEARLNDTRKDVKARSKALFRSASEICEIDLFPAGDTGFGNNTVFSNYWASKAQTGDNQRERPYAHIYPRLTTKSNVFTVYMRCQAIRKAPGSDANEFDPDKDSIVSEYRGSATIERFIDPNDQMLKDYNAATERADGYYRFRIVETKHFTPQ